jgi:hypothetical protein
MRDLSDPLLNTNHSPAARRLAHAQLQPSRIHRPQALITNRSRSPNSTPTKTSKNSSTTTKGQLRLRTPLNPFIGGQILDRGITIKNLIGFLAHKLDTAGVSHLRRPLPNSLSESKATPRESTTSLIEPFAR